MLLLALEPGRYIATGAYQPELGPGVGFPLEWSALFSREADHAVLDGTYRRYGSTEHPFRLDLFIPSQALGRGRLELQCPDLDPIRGAFRVVGSGIVFAGRADDGSAFFTLNLEVLKPGTLDGKGVLFRPWLSDADKVADEIEEFLTGVRHGAEPDRVLATVLFTDIVGATEKAASLGDRSWHDLLDAHHALVRRELKAFRGREIDTAGDGFLAAFDGPARAIRCACAVSSSVRSLGIEVRAGLHTGECEIMGDKLGGIAVHIGARIAALARPGEVLVSSTVKDLVAGSSLSFHDRGTELLKGLPGNWHLYAVAH